MESEKAIRGRGPNRAVMRIVRERSFRLHSRKDREQARGSL